MLFIIKQQHGIKQASHTVWDAEANSPLCEFVDGEFETDDEAIISKLEELGYEPCGADPANFPDPEPPVSDEKLLRDKAKELGIKSYHLKSVETLEKEIADLEGA